MRGLSKVWVIFLLVLTDDSDETPQYETASRRFYNGQNVSVLMCMARSWYAKATKDSSFQSMLTALKYAQEVCGTLDWKLQKVNPFIRLNISNQMTRRSDTISQ